MKKILILALVSLAALSCQVDKSEELPTVPPPTLSVMAVKPTNFRKEIQVDRHAPPGGFRLTKRRNTPYLTNASLNAPKYTSGKGRGKGGGKPPKGPYTPPTDTTGGGGGTDTTGGGGGTTDPAVGPAHVILIDADGHFLNGSSWNVSGPLTLTYSGMTEMEISQMVANVQRDYNAFDVLVTADSTEFFKRDPRKRMRVIVTESWEWYGQAGGVAYVGSMDWGDDTPCFVFSSLLGYSGKYIGDAASHEAGHTMGLRHQCDWKDGVKTSEYSQGFTSDHAPIMGVAYYDADGGEWCTVAPWFVGTWFIRNSYNQDQLDFEILRVRMGLRK